MTPAHPIPEGERLHVFMVTACEIGGDGPMLAICQCTDCAALAAVSTPWRPRVGDVLLARRTGSHFELVT